MDDGIIKAPVAINGFNVVQSIIWLNTWAAEHQFFCLQMDVSSTNHNFLRRTLHNIIHDDTKIMLLKDVTFRDIIRIVL